MQVELIERDQQMRCGTFLLISALLWSAISSAAGVAVCLDRASRATDPVSRDTSRIRCLKAHRYHIDTGTCIGLARGLEYSNNAEEQINTCVLGNDRRPTVRECLMGARSTQYGDNRDELIWGCLLRLNLSIHTKECLQLAKIMVLPVQKDRAISYCENEIRNSIN